MDHAQLFLFVPITGLEPVSNQTKPAATTELMDALRIFQQNIRYFIKPVTNCAEVNSFLELLQAVIYSIFGNLDRFDPIEANFVRLVKSHN